jgi:NADH-quinone oxidoreductase subunit L
VIGLAWLIPALPAVAFAIIGLFTLRFKRLSAALNIGVIAIATVLAYGVFFEALGGARSSVDLPWIRVGGNFDFPFGWQVDPLTAVMLVVVTTVSLLVQIYSLGYMHGDPGFSRYFAYMALFTAAMLGLVLANNLLTIYVFWEGVGLGSYLLIGFWYSRPPVVQDPSETLPVDDRPSPASAAKKAFVTTRLGDFGFLIGILIFWASTGTLNFAELAEQVRHMDPTLLTLACVLVFCGAVGKSAQFPLHVWLPDAMEGPTPVSALIHAATMVAAGVYLVARMLEIFAASPQALFVVAAIGGFTAIFAATMGLVSDDIKRVMAYSTVSQLGYMMLGLGSGVLAAGIFHLFTHAFFKALLFLTSGSFIHAAEAARRAGHEGIGRHGEVTLEEQHVDDGKAQRLSFLRGAGRQLPVTYGAMIIAALSLAGIVPFSGFWSKDAVLGAAYNQAFGGGGPGYIVLLLFALTTVFMTAFYMFRVIFILGHGSSPLHLHKEVGGIAGPLVVLAIPSVLIGLWGSPLFGEGFQRFLEGAHFQPEAMNLPMAALSTLLGLAGIGLAYLTYSKETVSAAAVTRAVEPLYRLPASKYYLDDLYQAFVDRVVLAFSRFLAFFVDRRIIDGGVNGIGYLAIAISATVRQVQSGRVQSYAMAVFAGLAVISVLTIVLRTAVK